MGEPPRVERLDEDRTHLANERTLLAYVRTALGFVATGVGVMGFLSADVPRWWGWAFVACGAVVMAVGAARFASLRARIKKGARFGGDD